MADPIIRIEEDLPPLTVRVTREMYSDVYQIHLPDDQMEELEINDVLKWFDDRGADMYAVEKAMDYVWNFRDASITIKKPKRIVTSLDKIIPKLT
jgi:hypothetical protein